MNRIEGTLKTEWKNWTQPTETPRYWLNFQRYKSIIDRGETRPHKECAGKHELEAYLLGIQVDQNDAKEWIKQVHEKGSIFIPNFMMPEAEIVGYEQQGAQNINL